MKHPNKAVMALGDRVWAVAEGVEGRGAAGGSVDRQASPGRRTGIGMPPKRGAHGSRLRADEKALDAITSDLRQEPGAGKPHAGICAGGGEQSPSLCVRRYASPLARLARVVVPGLPYHVT